MKNIPLYSLLLIVPGIVGSGCLGSSGSSDALDPVPVSLSPTTTTLSASAPSLALAVNDTALSASLTGIPRTFTLTNTGSTTATSVGYVASPALPAGTTISPANCGDLAPAATCVLTITPGATASAAPGDINPTAVTLAVAGTNTNTLSLSIDVLSYGSVYQAGYVFAVDDTTPNTGSIGGKVGALADQAPIFPNGITWSVAYDDIPGIYETSTNPPEACNGNSDGACNSQVIAAFYSPPTTNPAVSPSNYASGLCAAPIAGRTDWYLPAICEMGYDNGGGSGCGPMLQNMQTSLVENTTVAGLDGYYWSSTEFSINPSIGAFFQLFDSVGATDQLGANKADQLGVRCVRAITN